MKAVTWYKWRNPIAIAFIPISLNAIGRFLNTSAVAQIIADNTLGAEQSTLNQSDSLKFLLD